MQIICSDLEGVFVPEVWINVARKTGIEELRLTTRDIPDYNVLMRKRLGLLEKHGITIHDIQSVIKTMDPLEGALEFLNWVHSITQLIVVSDTFIEFAGPLMAKLNWPTLFCHNLTIDEGGFVTDYNLRQRDAKRHTVLSLKSINYEVIGMGDSYNDISMMKEADHGILFRPPQNVIDEYPQFPVCVNYVELKQNLEQILRDES